MALIICPECGKNFSDRANACPECGCPTAEILGKSTNISSGQLLIADNAFNDGRYEEAYQLFAQIYSQETTDYKVLIRLALVTGAKEYFANGIPNSTKDLFIKGLELIKNNTKEELFPQLVSVVADSKKVISDMKMFVAGELSSAINQTSSVRSTASIVTDALFMPVTSANRNLYEDRRTIENNKKILNNAIINKQIVTRTIDSLCSFILKSVADVLENPIENSNELYLMLGDFVINAEDSKIYSSISNNGTGNVYGLCFGEEKTILDFHDNCSFLHINDKPHAGGFAPPKGHLVLTNYKVVYEAKNEKRSFTQSLENLLRVEVGGPGGWTTHIALFFPGNIKVYITPDIVGTQAAYVAKIREELKMASR